MLTAASVSRSSVATSARSARSSARALLSSIDRTTLSSLGGQHTHRHSSHAYGLTSSLLADPTGEISGKDDVGGNQVADRLAAQREQRRVDARAEDVAPVADASRAAGGQPPQAGAADHDGAGAKGERLDDVAAAPDAAVEEDLGV